MTKSLLLLLTGLVAGLLLAPRKGSETWAMVLDKMDELKAGVGEELDEVAEMSVESI